MKFLNVEIPVKNLPSLDQGFVPLGLFFSSYEAGATKPICIAVERSGGQVDVYHLEGSVRKGRVEARHPSSGHHFTGRLMDDGQASGTLRLKSGLSFAIEARRTPDVPVTEDCAPVPADGWRVRKE